jgi:hypothetical protein
MEMLEASKARSIPGTVNPAFASLRGCEAQTTPVPGVLPLAESESIAPGISPSGKLMVLVAVGVVSNSPLTSLKAFKKSASLQT